MEPLQLRIDEGIEQEAVQILLALFALKPVAFPGPQVYTGRPDWIERNPAHA